jgi:hypothetical protein
MKLKVDFNNCQPVDASPCGEEARCICGSLVARVVAGGVELKCRRCRRIVLVPIDEQAFAALRGQPRRPPIKVGASPRP